MMDLPGAFLHADIEDNVHMLLEGTIAELIVKLDPSLYRKHIWYNQKGKPMLHVKLKSPVWYTTSGSIILEIIISTLQEWGFEINDYDHCDANKVINRRQCIIIWHVDDLRISHIE